MSLSRLPAVWDRPHKEGSCGTPALVFAEVRAPYCGRSTPLNAWWGSFDLAVNLFAAQSADPPLGEYGLDWEEVRRGQDPFDAAVSFARSVVRYSCLTCAWDVDLAASVDSVPPPLH